jgi:UDP:flavonoid glycosyltransferase YjiC (YdhE family)
VPHVILPLWIDLYNFATTSEYLGIGVWPGKETAPEWEAESLAEGFMQALTGETAASMREKAKALAKVAESYGGRDTAAAEVAKLAAQGV